MLAPNCGRNNLAKRVHVDTLEVATVGRTKENVDDVAANGGSDADDGAFLDNHGLAGEIWATSFSMRVLV